ncbi:glycosyltransferase family 4 protein [Gammaproteobacteria bacterium]|nr:glycosyltransferase family 4 protein [Gammaproteobacteria bacterium]
MKVLYFHQHFSIPQGPGAIRSYEMSKCLINRGHQVVMVCGSFVGNSTGLEGNFIKGRRRGNVEGIEVIEFDLAYSNADGFLSRTWTFLKYAFHSLIIVFTEKYDLIFATSTPLTASIPGIFAKIFKKKPFVFEVRDLWPELPKAMGVITNPLILSLMSALEWLSYHSANHLVALSPGIAEGIKKRGIKSEHITLIPNGCDIDIFEDTSQSWRPETINDKDFLAIFAGTHGIANGLNNVIDAAAELNIRGRKDIKILLIGSGQLKSSLIDRVNKEKLENVVFHDPVNKKLLSGLISSSNIGLQTLANVPAFYYGTSPNKFFDYLAGGLPVVNNYPGWIADIIKETNSGYVVPPEKPKVFADILEEAADNFEDLITKSKNAKKLASNRFNRKNQSLNWVMVLEKTYNKTKDESSLNE